VLEGAKERCLCHGVADAAQKSSPAHRPTHAGRGVSEMLERSQLMGGWELQELPVPRSFSGQVCMGIGAFPNIGYVRVNLECLSQGEALLPVFSGLTDEHSKYKSF